MRECGDLALLTSAWVALRVGGETPLLLVNVPALMGVAAQLSERLRSQQQTIAAAERVYQPRENIRSVVGGGKRTALPRQDRALALLSRGVSTLAMLQVLHGITLLANEAATITLLHYPPTPQSSALGSALEELRPRMDARNRLYALAPRSHQRLVTKLLCVAAFRQAGRVHSARE